MSGLREGRAVLKKRPLTAVSRPEAAVGGLAIKPVARFPSILCQPQREVCLLPRRLGVQSASKPKKVVRASEEGAARPVVLPPVDQLPTLARCLKQGGRPPKPAGVCDRSADSQGK
eukprot:7540031-Alexandrium_andersonii.AAC.1